MEGIDMISTSINSTFPCIGCTHSGVCKYEDSVMSFCRSNNTASTIDCLSIEYRCKYQQKTYASLSNGYRDFELTKISNTNTCGTTSHPYTIDTSSKCIDKI